MAEKTENNLTAYCSITNCEMKKLRTDAKRINLTRSLLPGLVALAGLTQLRCWSPEPQKGELTKDGSAWEKDINLTYTRVK